MRAADGSEAVARE